MNDTFFAPLIVAFGVVQLCVLVASALVPFKLEWRNTFQGLPQLHIQLFWIYGGYVVMAIVALAVISLVNSRELAAGGWLARSFCLYASLFWGVRLMLQPFLAVAPHLTTWWLRLGYNTLTVVFLALATGYAWVALAIR